MSSIIDKLVIDTPPKKRKSRLKIPKKINQTERKNKLSSAATKHSISLKQEKNPLLKSVEGTDPHAQAQMDGEKNNVCPVDRAIATRVSKRQEASTSKTFDTVETSAKTTSRIHQKKEQSRATKNNGHWCRQTCTRARSPFSVELAQTGETTLPKDKAPKFSSLRVNALVSPPPFKTKRSPETPTYNKKKNWAEVFFFVSLLNCIFRMSDSW